MRISVQAGDEYLFNLLKEKSKHLPVEIRAEVFQRLYDTCKSEFPRLAKMCQAYARELRAGALKRLAP